MAKPGFYSRILASRLPEWGIVAAFLYQRLKNIPGVFTPLGIFPNGTDPYYRFYRIVSWLREGHPVPMHDPQLTSPIGFDVPWPQGLDGLLALLAKLLGLTDPVWIEGLASLTVPFLALATLWIVYDLANRWGGRGLARVAALILVFFGAHVQPTSVGEIDHHVLESLFVLWTLHALLRASQNPSRWELAGLLGIATFFWPQAWILSLMVWMGILFDAQTRQTPIWTDWAWVFGGSSMMKFVIAWTALSGTASRWSLFGVSYWGAAVDAGLAWTCLCLSIAGEPAPRRRRFAWTAWILSAVVGAYALFASPVLGQFKSVFQAQRSFLSLTSESSTIFSEPKIFFFLAGTPFLAGFIAFSVALVRRERALEVGFSMIPLFLSCLQWRFLFMGSALIALWAGVAFQAIRNRWPDARTRVWMGLVLLALLSPGVFRWRLTHERNAHPQFLPVVAASRELAKSPRGNVLAPWDFGHWILYYAGQSPVAHPFQSGISVESTRLWVSAGLEPMEAFRSRVPFRYVIAEAPSGKLKRWLDYFEIDPAPYFESNALENASLRPKPNFYDLALARLYFGLGVGRDGNGSEHWRLIHVSPYPSAENPKLAALKAFEYVEGWPLTAKGLRPNARYRIEAELSTVHGPEIYRRHVTADAQGTLRTKVPYIAVDSPTVRFNGAYRILQGDKTVATARVAP